MSKTDEKGHETSTDAVSREGETADHNDVATGKKEEGGFIILFFIMGLVGALIVGWWVFPMVLYSKKQQPVAFNHKLHVALVKNGCKSCHYFRPDGSFSGIPTIKECKTCHKETIGESKQEAVFMNKYVYKNRQVPWLVYSKQPPCVFFSHAAHVLMGHMACKTCHGNIGESVKPKPYEVNRISGYSRNIWGYSIAGIKKNTYDRMKMDDCAECHAKIPGNRTSVQTNHMACFACHK